MSRDNRFNDATGLRPVPLTALDLRLGDRVADNFTNWAEVVSVGQVATGIRVVWRLADGRRETTTYRPEDRFTLLGSG